MQEMVEYGYDAIYARQSIDKADSVSVESQIEFCIFETRGNPYQIFADRGYSGKNTDRPEFQRMLYQLRSGKIRRVICYKLDRCSRSILDFAAFIEELQKYSVEFVSCTEKFDTATPIGRAMLNICIVFAQLERETIQQRVTDAYYSRSKKGFYMGGRIPFGFRLAPYHIDGKHTARYEPDEAEIKVLRILFERYAQKNASLGSVAASMENDRLQNPRRPDGKWIRSNIGKLLSNPIYVKADIRIYQYYKSKGVNICNDLQSFIGTNGCYLYKDKDAQQYLVLAPHEGLIESDLWLQCRNKKMPNRKRTKGNSCRSFLSGKLKCGNCGKSLVITSSGKNRDRPYHYIVCPHSHGADRICSGVHGWKLEELEQIITEQLIMFLYERFPLLSNPAPIKKAKQPTLDISIAQIQREIEEIAAKAVTAADELFIYLNAHARDLESKKKELIMQCKKQVSSSQKYQIKPDYQNKWEYLTPEDKREILDAVISHITVSDAKAMINWRI